MTLPKYGEYKDSGERWLGAIPTHWQVLRLKNLFEIRKRVVGEDGHQVLSITQRGIKVKDVESNDGQLSMDYSKYQIVQPGDFAMNHMDLLTGFVDISPYAGVTSPDYRVFTVRDGVACEPRYFLYLLQNGYRQKVFYAFGQGASEFGRWRFPTDQFNDFCFPYPSLSEQVTIATFLDSETAKIDTLIAEQEKLIALLAEKRQATISRAVTQGLNPNAPMRDSGLEWLGKIPAHWTTARLGHLTTQIVDGAHFTPTYVDEGIPFLRVTDITRGLPELDEVKRIPEVEHLELCRRCRPRKGDLLLSKNGTIGVPKVVTWDWEFSIFVSLCLLKMRPAMLASFAANVFESSTIKIQIDEGAKQSTVTNLHLEKIAEFRFPVPPVSEQEDIIAFLQMETSRLDALANEAERAVNLLKERRSALIAAAVTGQVDVRNVALR